MNAGLPNITGSFKNDVGNTVAAWVTASGAFYGDGSVNKADPEKVNSYYVKTDTTKFNASRSNEIYGNSVTVQPPAVSTIYVIKH